MDDEQADNSEDFQPGGDQSIVEGLAQYAGESLVDTDSTLASVRAELPSGGTIVVAVGIYRAGEWLHNSVTKEIEAGPPVEDRVIDEEQGED